ncbi:MAG: M14 family metallopeptidase, partial [Acidobacteria bacterium]|nr:M14 family metallopeptidase [Acidobacteriota bacterium]
MDDAKLASWFSASYFQARTRFVARCEDLVGGEVDSYQNPHGHGVDGERLYTDVATFGREDARATLIISSGTHGIEGYCGSGVQLALMGCDLL